MSKNNEILKAKNAVRQKLEKIPMTKNEATMVDKFLRAVKQQLRAKQAPKIVVNGVTVRMPLELILSRVKFTQMQLNIMVTVMKVIGIKIAHELQSESLGSLFAKAEFGESEDIIRFSIKEREFGYPKKYKDDLRNAIKLMCVVPIEFPIIGNVSNKVYIKSTNLCSIVEPEHQNEEDPFYIVEINREVADYVVNSSTYYANIIEIANKQMKSKYSIKMYMFTVAICGQDSISFTFEYLRDQFSKGIERHKKYGEFEREVLSKSKDDIFRLYEKGLLDYWFEYHPTAEERIQLKQRNNPEEVLFVFHRRNELPSPEKKNTHLTVETLSQIEEKLVDEFKIFPPSAKEVVSKLTLANVEDFDKIVQKVREHIAKGIDAEGKPIKDKRFYAYGAFNKFFMEKAGGFTKAEEIKEEVKEKTTFKATAPSEDSEYTEYEELFKGADTAINGFPGTNEVVSKTSGNISGTGKGQKYWRKQFYNCKGLMERFGYELAKHASHLMNYKSYDENNKILHIQIPGPTTEVQELIERNLNKMIMWHITKYFPSDVTIEYEITKFVQRSDEDKKVQLKCALDQQRLYSNDVMDINTPLFSPKDEKGMSIPKEVWGWNYAMKLISERITEQEFNDIFAKLEFQKYENVSEPPCNFIIEYTIGIPSMDIYNILESEKYVKLLQGALYKVFKQKIKIFYHLPKES